MTFEPLRVAMGPLQRAAARVSDFFFYLRDNTPLTQEDVLREEGRAIRDSDVGPDLTGLSGKELNRALNARNSVALCLSGGGIRSASFALGIIQALAVHPRAPKTNHVSDAEKCWLAQVRYLSTVSGGGYIGGWLSTWLFHAHGDVGGGWNAVWKGLVNERDDPINEPKEISWLRRYSNFLTPKLGITSADTWAAATLIVRNLLLNWLIIVPVLAAALLILKLLAIAVAWVSQINAISSGVVFWPLLIVGCFCLILCLRFTTKTRPTRGPSRATRSEFLWRDLLPAALAAVFFTLSLAAADAEYYVHSGLISMGQMQARGLLILMGAGALVYAAGWIVAFAERASF